MNGNTMFNATVLSQSPMCPKCRRLASLRLRARLREADGFPEVQCLECGGCGEVVVVERGVGERTQFAQDTAVRLAA
jgi:RNase P subunit RPR2